MSVYDINIVKQFKRSFNNDTSSFGTKPDCVKTVVRPYAKSNALCSVEANDQLKFSLNLF